MGVSNTSAEFCLDMLCSAHSKVPVPRKIEVSEYTFMPKAKLKNKIHSASAILTNVFHRSQEVSVGISVAPSRSSLWTSCHS